MAEIPIHNRAGEVIAVVVLDKRDLGWASQYRWSLSAGYAVRGKTIGGRANARHLTFSMHRELLGLEHGDKREVDHINRNKLDNRRANLRVVTRAENKQNLDGYARSTSHHRGVSWNARRNQWVARGRLDGVVHCLGEFKTENEAARAAADWRRRHMPFSEEAA